MNIFDINDINITRSIRIDRIDKKYGGFESIRKHLLESMGDDLWCEIEQQYKTDPSKSSYLMYKYLKDCNFYSHIFDTECLLRDSYNTCKLLFED